ncbi:MAG: glutathione S-transferase family protein [Solirubrobacteraceae bacterium]
MTVTLWHIELSHYSEKARWALDHKGIEHRRRVPLVGAHQLVAMALTRSGHRRMPVLRLDGRAIGDSTAIIAALEARFPEPPLYPADPAERARALALEDFFDEELAPALRAFSWHHVLGQHNGIGDSIAPTRPAIRRMLNVSAPLAGRIIRGDYGATAERETETRAEIVAAADRLEHELQPSGYLVGDRFSVADLTAAALFTPVITPPERPYVPEAFPPAVVALRDELLAREAGRWVTAMYARHRGAWHPGA